MQTKKYHLEFDWDKDFYKEGTFDELKEWFHPSEIAKKDIAKDVDFQEYLDVVDEYNEIHDTVELVDFINQHACCRKGKCYMKEIDTEE